jgi:hypothetical protein
LTLGCFLLWATPTAALASELKSPMGDHLMSGTISKIDHAKGMLTVMTDEGPLDLHFPPASIMKLTNGEEVVVELAISPEAVLTGEPRH